MQDFEKLGQFYLGHETNLASGETSPDPLLYDSRDLTTHAVVVGMTGSGKTGLCVDLLEEAGMDGSGDSLSAPQRGHFESVAYLSWIKCRRVSAVDR